MRTSTLRHRNTVRVRPTSRQRVVSAPTVVARSISTYPRPLYDEVVSAPIANDTDYSPPLYDTVAPAPVAPAPVVSVTPVVQDEYTTPFIYVYEPNRILVVDPNTGIAVQAIPR